MRGLRKSTSSLKESKSGLDKSKKSLRKSTCELKESKGGLLKSRGELRKSKTSLRKSTSGKVFSRLKLKRDIMREGRVLNKHAGAVEMVAERVCDEVEKWVNGRPEITKADLDRVTAARIRKYDRDLAYVYENRDKII